MAKNVVKTLLTAQDKTGPAFNSANANMNKLKTVSAGLMKVLGPLAAAAGVGAIVSMGKHALDSADRISKLSDSIGISTTVLSQYDHAAQLSGTSLETVATSLKKMQKNVSDAADGLSTAKRAFSGLNLSIDELQSMNPEEAFELIGEELSKVDDRARRTQIAMNIFGRSGADLLPMFKDGAAGIREMREEANRLGITLDEDAAQKAADAKDAMQRLDTVFKGMGQTLAIELAPAVTDFGNSLSGTASQVGAFIQKTRELSEAEGGYAHWKKAQEADKLLEDLGLATAATLGFIDALNGIPDAGNVFQFGATTQAPEAFDSSSLKDLSLPESFNHESMMQASADVEELAAWWGSLPPALDSVKQTAASATPELEGLTDAADRVGQTIGDAAEDGADRLANSLADAVAQGKLELIDLGNIARSVFGEIFSGFLRLGIQTLITGATGGAAAPALGFVGGSPIIGIPGLKSTSGVIGGGKSGGSVQIGSLNVNIPQSVNFGDPMAKRDIAKAIYEELQTVASHHGPED